MCLDKLPVRARPRCLVTPLVVTFTEYLTPSTGSDVVVPRLGPRLTLLFELFDALELQVHWLRDLWMYIQWKIT